MSETPHEQPFPDDLSLVTPGELRTRLIGRELAYYPEVGSTNDIARAAAGAGHAEGLVVIAGAQTAGRGRMGRGWASPPGASLLLSILLRPALAPPDAFLLTMLAGVALCEAVEQAAGVRAALKWPNDLLLPSPAGGAARKAAGVLSEIELSNSQIAWAVLGIGLNVAWTPTGTVDGRDLASVATSVADAAGRPVSRRGLLRALLGRLDARYLAICSGEHEPLRAEWRARLATIGQRVSVRRPDGALTGIAEGVEQTGALRLRDDAGRLHIITAGDVEA